MQNQNCFLLSYVKYGDNDAFLHCFSLEEGYQSFFAKAVYSIKNKKKPYLFPLNLLNISFIKKGNNKSVSTLSKMELAGEFCDFDDIKKNSILFFVAEFLNQILREEGSNKLAFNAILIFRENLKVNNFNAHLILLFQFLPICGIAPLPNKKKYLNPESGIFEDEISHVVFGEEISAFWNLYLVGNLGEIQINRTERNALLESLMYYYQLHFTGFYTPNSLAVLRQIFE